MGWDGREGRSQGSPHRELPETPLTAVPPTATPKYRHSPHYPPRPPVPPGSRKDPGGSGQSQRPHWKPGPGLEPSFLVGVGVGQCGWAMGQTHLPARSPILPASGLPLPLGVNPVCARLSLLRAPGRRSRCLLSAATPGDGGKSRGSHLLPHQPQALPPHQPQVLPQAQPYLGHPAGSPPG